MPPVTDQERAWINNMDRLHLLPTGSVDLLSLFAALNALGQSRVYIDISRRLRAERRLAR